MARGWFRPVWVTHWISLVIGGMLLVPTQLPDGRPLLPITVLWAVPLEFLAILLLALSAEWRRWRTTTQGGTAFLTAPTSAGVYSAGGGLVDRGGGVVLRRGGWGRWVLGGFGMMGLFFLVASDHWAGGLDADGKGLRDFLR